MKREVLILSMIALILSACGFESGELTCETGREGVHARFVSSNFPDNIQQDVRTPILIEIENAGAYPSKQVFAWLRYGQDFFEVNDSEVTVEDLQGRTPYNKCTPQVRRAHIDVTAYPLPFASTSFDRPLTIDLCYHYSNNVSTSVCVDPMPSEINALEPDCRPSDRRLTGGQGSPVGITRIDAPIFIRETETTGKVRLGVHLENYGDGIILAFEQPNEPLESCTYQEDTHEDYVFFKAFLDNYRLDCSILGGPGRTDEDEVFGKVFLRYDPEVVETDTGTRTLKKHFLICESDTIELDTELEMTFDAEMHYYYRESHADERMTTIRKI